LEPASNPLYGFGGKSIRKKMLPMSFGNTLNARNKIQHLQCSRDDAPISCHFR